MATNSSNFMYSGTSKPTSTPGGYQASSSRSETGYYRTSVIGAGGIGAGIPFTPMPVPASEMKRGRKAAQYTYRNYAVPDFENSELVGMPAGAFPMMNGEQGYDDIRNLGNTTANLNAISGWPRGELQKVQTVMVKAGWIPKNSATGRPNDKTLNAVAFLMEQGNRLGVRWEDIAQEGPEWLRRVGGADVVDGSANGPGSTAYDGPVTSVSKSVNYTTKAGARSLLKDTLASVLGRGPRDEEVDEFLDLLRSKEKANPTVSTTISDGNDEGSFNESSSVTKGGFDAEQAGALAERYATNIDPVQASEYKRAGYEQLLDSLIMGG